jgi:hypothetical protein
MTVARAGGFLLIVGSVAVGVWGVAFNSGAPAGPPGPGVSPSDRMLVVAFALILSIGAGIVGLVAPLPLDSRLTRVGLGLIAVGMLTVGLGRAVVVIPTGSNELSSLPYLILVFGGVLATAVGSLLCGTSLVRSPSVVPRIVGLALLGGPVSLPLAAFISLPLHVDASVIVLIGLGLVLLGYAGIGLLAMGVAETQRRSEA